MADEEQMSEVIPSEGEKEPDPSKSQASDAALVSADANNALEEKLGALEPRYDFRELAKQYLSSDTMASVASMNEAMRAIQGSSAASELAKQMKLLEQNPAVVKFAEQWRSIETSPVLKHISDSASLMENSAVLKQMRDTARLLEQNSELKRATLGLDELQRRAASAFGPIWELRDAGILSRPLPQLEAIQRALINTEAALPIADPGGIHPPDRFVKREPNFLSCGTMGETVRECQAGLRTDDEAMARRLRSDTVDDRAGGGSRHGLGASKRSGFRGAAIRVAQIGPWRLARPDNVTPGNI